jgi:hypothetical protein
VPSHLNTLVKPDIVICPDNPFTAIRECVRRGKIIGYPIAEGLGHTNNSYFRVMLKLQFNTAVVAGVVNKIYANFWVTIKFN